MSRPGLLRVVYFSRNRISRPLGEMHGDIDQILRTAQRNNAAFGVTGALVFNGAVFGQILEGPRQGVEEIFERIQCDGRHSDITVLDLCPIDARSFEGWAMGYVGHDCPGSQAFAALGPAVQPRPAGQEADLMLRKLQELALRNELRRTAV